MPRLAIALVALLRCAPRLGRVPVVFDQRRWDRAAPSAAISLPASVPTIGAGGWTRNADVTVAPECVWKASSDADWIAITTTPTVRARASSRSSRRATRRRSMRRGAVTRRRGSRRARARRRPLPIHSDTADADVWHGRRGRFSRRGGDRWLPVDRHEQRVMAVCPRHAERHRHRHRSLSNRRQYRLDPQRHAEDRRSNVRRESGRDGNAVQRQPRPAPNTSLGATGGDDVVSVTAPADCPWTATSHAPWITVTSGASGSGTGTVRLSIAPNTGGLRVGLVTITGHTYVVTQAGAAGTCSYSIGATGQSAPAAAGTGSVAVSASSGCAWTAVSQAPWITITSGNSGNGNGVVTLAIAANTGGERVGLVTVAGFTYTVTQQEADGHDTVFVQLSATQLTAPASRDNERRWRDSRRRV